MSRFLFIIPTLSRGGAERVVSVLSSSLARVGAEALVIKYYDTPEEYVTDAGVRIFNLSGGDRRAYEKMSYPQRILALRKAIAGLHPDFVIPFMFSIARDVSIASVGLRCTVIQSIRINPAIAPASRLQRKWRDYLVYRSKCTFVQNEKQRQYFRKRKETIHVLYNPVSENLLGVSPSFSNTVFTVSAAGRLERQKNFRLLIDSFCQAFQEGTPAILNIYGEGSLAQELSAYVAVQNRAGSIRLMGRSECMEEVYRGSDLFVLSSDFEGMPNALIEAMACGLPCVSTDCPTGPSDLIEDGVNGLLVPVRDPAAMARAIRRIYDDRDASHEMGRKAKETVAEKCDAVKIAREIISICENL